MNKINLKWGLALPVVGSLLFASCAPVVMYHWQLIRPRADANLSADRANCNGYANQFKRDVTRPEQPGDGRNIGTAFAAGSENINAIFAERARINEIFEGCMSRIGWVLVPDGPQE